MKGRKLSKLAGSRIECNHNQLMQEVAWWVLPATIEVGDVGCEWW